MAEDDFEADLGALFDRPEPQADSGAFAAAVERRIARMQWFRIGLISAFAGLGVLIAWLQLGFSIGDLTGALAFASRPLSLQWDNVGLWAGALLAGLAAWLVVQALNQEA